MKNQTPRLNAKTVNADLYTGNTTFSRSRCEIQVRRQPASSGGGALRGTNLEWGTGEARPEVPIAGRFLESSLQFPPQQSGGAL